MLVLASQSPRRRELLASAGIPFVARSVNVPEDVVAGESPEEHVRRLACAKADSIAVPAGGAVLGADTVVVVDGEILGKPAGAADAERMLGLLSGRSHEVLTGICLRTFERRIVEVEVTRVWFAPLDREEIRIYVASGEPMDKAGAYAIQGGAAKFVERIEGCYFNVVGLPLARVYRGLRGLGLL